MSEIYNRYNPPTPTVSPTDGGSVSVSWMSSSNKSYQYITPVITATANHGYYVESIRVQGFENFYSSTEGTTTNKLDHTTQGGVSADDMTSTLTFDGLFMSGVISRTSSTAVYRWSYTIQSITVTFKKAPSYTISLYVHPASSGTVSGGGTFFPGDSCTVTATPNAGYTFTKWADSSLNTLSTSADYTFIVTPNGKKDLVAVFTGNAYTVSVSADPSAGGTVSGGGTYSYGDSCTVTATPNVGYAFTKWTKNGTTVSTNASYSFTVSESVSLVAVFTKFYVVRTSADEERGTTEGDGTFYQGDSCTVAATPNIGYRFTKWTKNGTKVSTKASYTFTVTESVELVAVFAADFTYRLLRSSAGTSLVRSSGGVLMIDA